MGCTCHKPYNNKVSDLSSNRSIGHQRPNPGLHMSISPRACGYVFSLNHQQAAQVTAKSKQSRRREQQQDLYQQLQAQYFRLKKEYQQHNIDACMETIQRLQQLEKQLDYSYLDVKAEEKAQLIAFINSLKEKYEQMVRFTKYIDRQHWQDHGDKEGVRLYTNREGGTVAVMMETVIDVPVEIFLTVVSEMDFYIDLMDNISESREEVNLARNHKIGYCVYDLPILSIREAIFQAIGYDRLKHNGTIFMYSQSIHNLPKRCKELGYIPPVHDKYVQIDYKYLIISYVPTGVNRGKATIAVNTDMKISFVPLALMEMVSKSICLKFLDAIKEVSYRFAGSKWEEKMKRHPATFQFFKSVIAEYYQSHGMTK